MLEAPPATGGSFLPHRGAPALASLGLTPWLDAEPRPATVMGTSNRFAWCAVGDEIVMLASPDAVRFPNAILASGGWNLLEPGDEILIGLRTVVGRGVDWYVVRWWDSSVVPIGADRSDVMERVSCVPGSVAPSIPRLEAALASRERGLVIDTACDLLGAGGGLTPEGDDRLIGALAAFRHVTSSLGHGHEFLADLADELLTVASGRTTLLSVTLLRHALDGEVPEPVAGLMRALTGHSSLATAVERCLGIGHSSGRAMVHGVVSGARAACRVAA